MRIAAIAPGDIVEVDKKGRRFFGRVEQIDEDGTVQFAPLCRGVSHRRASGREVIGHWRRMGRRRAQPSGPSVDDADGDQLGLS